MGLRNPCRSGEVDFERLACQVRRSTKTHEAKTLVGVILWIVLVKEKEHETMGHDPFATQLLDTRPAAMLHVRLLFATE